MSLSSDKRFILIGGGHGECGTNVIRRLLCKHTDVEWIARKDTFFLEALANLLPFLEKEEAFYLPRLTSQKYIEFRNHIGHIFGNNSEVRKSLDFLESEILTRTIYIPVFGKLPLAKSHSQEKLHLIFREFAEILFHAGMVNPTASIGCEKTPSNAQYINLAQQMIPNSKAIIIHRHPVDLAVSLLSFNWGPNSLVGAALFTKTYLDRWDIVKENINPSYYMTLKYEDVILDPVTELCRSCEFIEIESDSILSNEISSDDLITTSNRKKLDKQEFIRIKNILSSCCLKLGYDVDRPLGEYEWIK